MGTNLLNRVTIVILICQELHFESRLTLRCFQRLLTCIYWPAYFYHDLFAYGFKVFKPASAFLEVYTIIKLVIDSLSRLDHVF